MGSKPNIKDRRGTCHGKSAVQVKLSRYRSVAVGRGKGPRGKAWGIVLRNRGIETAFGLSDEAMDTIIALVERQREIERIQASVNGVWKVIADEGERIALEYRAALPAIESDT